MEEDTTSDYDNSHRAFLQAFMGCAVMTFEQAKPILAAILTAQEQRETLPNDITEAGFSNYVATCNNAISRFDFEIRSTLSQHDRTRVWALVNTTSDAITQLATTHSADEINYVKRVLDAMFETHNTRRREIMAIRSKEAINLHRPSRNRESGAASNGVNTQNGGEAPTGQGLSMSQAERVLDGLVEEGWFERSGAGFYSLSPRALMELRQWLIETYNEPPGDDEDEDDQIRQDRIKLCQACKEIVTIGQRCPDLDCTSRLHNHCKRNIFRVQNAEQCPVCKKAWEGAHAVGEAAAPTTGRQSTGGASRRTTVQPDGADSERESTSDEG